jgi:hypothetical protein
LHLQPGSQVPTSTPIVLTYNDQTTVPAALFTTMEQQVMDPTPRKLAILDQTCNILHNFV